MDKSKLRYFWKRVKVLKPWYFLVLAAVFAGIFVFAARANNLRMIELRDEVAKVDKENGDVEKALRNLREYVYGHMNTNLSSGANNIKPPIQLKYTYERLVAAEKKRVEQENAGIYTDAQQFCEAKYPDSYYGGPRVPCISEYVSKRGTVEKQIPDSLYKFDFVSPTWTPDLAGWSLVLSVASLIMFLSLASLDRLIRHELE